MRERFVILKSGIAGAATEHYYQRRARCGRPVVTRNLKLARKWDTQAAAYCFAQALIKNPQWKNAFVGTV